MLRGIIYINVVLLLTAFQSCNKGGGDSIRPGVYVRYAKTQFGDIYDSLRIWRTGPQLIIERSWVYNRGRDGKTIPERKSQMTTVVMQENAKYQREQQSGRVVYWDAERLRLFIGTSEYKRIK